MRCRLLLLFVLALSLISVAGCKSDPTSLMTAVRADNTAEAIKLIGKGADANSRTSPNGWSALHYAAMNGNAEIVKALLKAVLALKPYSLALGMLDVVCEYNQPSDREAKLREAGLDDPVLLKNVKDSKVVEHYQDVVGLLINITKE